MIPVSCLLATVFTIGNLNKSNELVALFSCGMSLARVSAPTLILVTIISAMSFWAADRILPVFAQKKNYVYYVKIKQRPGLYSTVKTNKIWYRSGNILYNIKTLNPQAKRAQGISLYYFDDVWRLTQLISANSVKMKGQDWTLSDGTITLFTEKSSFPLTQNFDKKSILMGEEAGDLTSTASSAEQMTLSDLAGFIKKNREAGLDTLRYEVDYHSKFGFAFAAFVMSLLGIPFSVGGGRSGGTIKNIGLCMGVTFLYWSFYSSFITLGQHGAIPPVLAAWVPNFTTVFLAIYLLIRLKR
jgi:lipopolysaccharide export system permease protein